MTHVATWPLTSLWLTAGLGTAALCTMLRTAPRLGSHRGRVWAFVLLALAAASFTNCYFAYLPRVGDLVGPRPWPQAPLSAVLTPRPDARSHPDGAVLSVPIRGSRSGVRERSAFVYVPPQYFSQPQERFAVLYLLHGSPGVPLDWFRGGEAATAGLAAARHGRPVILVAPRMSRGWLDDSECVDRPGLHAESYLTQDVIPTIDSLFRTAATAADRGLAGNSSGGYCALSIGLRHPALFSHIAALSPLTLPTYTYGSLADLFGHPADLHRAIEEHTPSWLLEHQPGALDVSIRLDVGSSDPVAPDVRRLAADDQRLHGHVVLVSRGGGHTFRVWRPALHDAVLWFAGQVGGEPAGRAHAATLAPASQGAEPLPASGIRGMTRLTFMNVTGVARPVVIRPVRPWGGVTESLVT